MYEYLRDVYKLFHFSECLGTSLKSKPPPKQTLWTVFNWKYYSQSIYTVILLAWLIAEKLLGWDNFFKDFKINKIYKILKRVRQFFSFYSLFDTMLIRHYAYTNGNIALCDMNRWWYIFYVISFDCHANFDYIHKKAKKKQIMPYCVLRKK